MFGCLRAFLAEAHAEGGGKFGETVGVSEQSTEVHAPQFCVETAAGVSKDCRFRFYIQGAQETSEFTFSDGFGGERFAQLRGEVCEDGPHIGVLGGEDSTVLPQSGPVLAAEGEGFEFKVDEVDIPLQVLATLPKVPREVRRFE